MVLTVFLYFRCRKKDTLRSTGWSLKGVARPVTQDVEVYVPETCRHHDVKCYTHGTLDGKQVWTSMYKKPKRDNSGCYFVAVHKTLHSQRFLIIQNLMYCTTCKVFLIIADELQASAFVCGDVSSSNTFVVDGLANGVVMRCSDYTWFSAYYLTVGPRNFFSVIQEVKLSD